MIEYMPWYQAGAELLRCSGDGGCGALLISGDTEVHTRWHKKIEAASLFVPPPYPRPIKGTW